MPTPKRIQATDNDSERWPAARLGLWGRGRQRSAAEGGEQSRRGATSPAAHDTGGLPGMELVSRLTPAAGRRPDRLARGSGPRLRRAPARRVTHDDKARRELDQGTGRALSPSPASQGATGDSGLVAWVVGGMRSPFSGPALVHTAANRGQHLCGRVTAPVGPARSSLRHVSVVIEPGRSGNAGKAAGWMPMSLLQAPRCMELWWPRPSRSGCGVPGEGGWRTPEPGLPVGWDLGYGRMLGLVL